MATHARRHLNMDHQQSVDPISPESFSRWEMDGKKDYASSALMNAMLSRWPRYATFASHGYARREDLGFSRPSGIVDATIMDGAPAPPVIRQLSAISSKNLVSEILGLLKTDPKKSKGLFCLGYAGVIFVAGGAVGDQIHYDIEILNSGEYMCCRKYEVCI